MKSPEQLKADLFNANSKVAVGAIYSHYKHPDQPYRVMGLAIIEATGEVGVIYQAEYGDRITFIRPLSSFLDQVDLHGLSVPRFAEITGR